MDPDHLPEISYGIIDAAYARRLATVDPADDGPIWMVNLMRYRERAVYADGRETDLTGREADDRYAPFGPFRTVGAELVFLADVDEQLIGDDPAWERIAVVRYPTRKAFLDMQDLPEYGTLHEHKDAGMAATFVIGCRPADMPELPADAPPLDAVPHPSTAADGPVIALHVLRYHEGRTSEDMELYRRRGRRGGPAPRCADRCLVRRGGYGGRRRTGLGPGPVQRVPVPPGVPGGRPRSGPHRRPGRPPRAGHRRHLHASSSAP